MWFQVPVPLPVCPINSRVKRGTLQWRVMDLTLARQSELQLATEQMEAHAIGQMQ